MTRRNTVELLRGVSLRVTTQRIAVLEILGRHPHSDTRFLTEAVRKAIGSVSGQAIYDALAALELAGLVRKVEPAGSPALYELRTGDNHHHLVCRRCGVLADVDCVKGEAPCLTPSSTAGFVVDEAEVIFWGLCPSCASTDR
ncbi:MAG: transcriptional repressor [Mycobacterium sp.]